MHDAPPEDILKWEDLIYIVDFFQAGGDTNISLLGGEPFLHPDIVDYNRTARRNRSKTTWICS